MSPDRLWHFTCDHGHDAIGTRGLLQPNQHPMMPDLRPVVWLTSDPSPDREAVGLSSSFISCDRMAYRYRVVPPYDAHAWEDVSMLAPDAVRRDLERFGDPGSWWLCAYPVQAVLS